MSTPAPTQADKTPTNLSTEPGRALALLFLGYRWKHGLKQNKLQKDAGLSVDQIRNIENGRVKRGLHSESLLNLFALKGFPESVKCPTLPVALKYLGEEPVVPQDVVAGWLKRLGADQRPRTGWTRAEWPHLGRESILVELLNDAKLVVSCTQGLDSYLLPRELNESFWREKLKHERRPPAIAEKMWRSHMTFTDDTRTVRIGQPFRHRLLVCRTFLDGQSYGNRMGIRENLKNYHDLIEPSIAEPDVWEQMRANAAATLSLSSDWHKLLVIDERIAVIWYRQEDWMFTEDPYEVAKVRKALDDASRAFPVDRLDKHESKRTKRIWEEGR